MKAKYQRAHFPSGIPSGGFPSTRLSVRQMRDGAALVNTATGREVLVFPKGNLEQLPGTTVALGKTGPMTCVYDLRTGSKLHHEFHEYIHAQPNVLLTSLVGSPESLRVVDLEKLEVRTFKQHGDSTLSQYFRILPPGHYIHDGALTEITRPTLRFVEPAVDSR